MTKEEVQEWRARWRLVNEWQIEELRRTPLEVKVRQLDALMASVAEFGWREKLEEGDAEVRARWARLRKAARA